MALNVTVLASVPDGAAAADDAPTEKAASDDTLETIVQAIRYSIKQSDQHRITAGQRLEEAKRRVEAGEVVLHGKRVSWKTWLSTNLDGMGVETARRYVLHWVAEDPERTEAERVNAKTTLLKIAEQSREGMRAHRGRLPATPRTRSTLPAPAALTLEHSAEAEPEPTQDDAPPPVAEEATGTPEPVDNTAPASSPEPAQPAPTADTNVIKLDAKTKSQKSRDEEEADNALGYYNDLTLFGRTIFHEKAGLYVITKISDGKRGSR